MAEAQRRKSIALKDKLLIVNDLETGKKTQTSICRKRDLPKSTVATIWANRSKLKNSVEDGASSSRRKRMRGVFHMYIMYFCVNFQHQFTVNSLIQ